MTDLELTKACAEKMGFDYAIERSRFGIDAVYLRLEGENGYYHLYEPIHNDAQMVAIVKKFGIKLEKFDGSGRWLAGAYSWNTDLNRAVCECVAKL